MRAILASCIGLGALTLALALTMPQPAAAQGEGALSGRIVNGTSGGPPPAGLEITLLAIGTSGEPIIETTTTDALGEFTFGLAEPQEGFSYILVAQQSRPPAQNACRLSRSPERGSLSGR